MLKKIRGPAWAHTTLPILLGLLLVQLITTFFVWRSNQQLLQQAQALTAAGWSPLPSGPAIAQLATARAALGGGLFFTLSSGAGLVLAAWAAVQLRHRLRLYTPGARALLLILWSVTLVAVNSRGIVLFPSLLVVTAPALTGVLSIWGLRRRAQADRTGPWHLPLAALILLALLWSLGTWRTGGELFTSIRDYVLLSNAVGRQVNDFYYTYTLNAAAVFKSLEQKTIRTCRLTTPLDMATNARLHRLLAAGDVLVLPSGPPTDLTIAADDTGGFSVTAAGRRLSVDGEAALQPARWLPQLSRTTDRFSPFRRLTMLGLLIGFPVLLYITLYGGLRWLIGMLRPPAAATTSTTLLCLAIGILLLLLMRGGRLSPISDDTLSTALQSDRWTERVAALRWATDHHWEITDYPDYRTLAASPQIAERCWLARALAVGRAPAATGLLLEMLKDPHPNVVCQALHALGKRGDRRAIGPIRAHLAHSDHWYTQWYAYRALKDLGWRQIPSR